MSAYESKRERFKLQSEFIRRFQTTKLIFLKFQCVVRMKNCVVETWDPQEGPSFPKQFTFDSTYDQDSQTETIYNEICYPLVEVGNNISFRF